MQNKRVMFITQAAVIAALYAVLTIGQNLLLPGTASMAVQFRVAEAMTMLACLTPAAIPGLTIGCVIANISSVTAGLGFYDMIFGSIASLLAAVTMYMLRNVCIKGTPFLAALMPALFNGIIVGWEISYFFAEGGFTFTGFLITGGCVALGELVVCLVLGIPLYHLIKRRNLIRQSSIS